MNDFWHSKTIDQIAKDLNTDLKFGLKQEEAEKRLKKYGQNKLPEKKPFSWFKILVDQFCNPLIYILCAAALITFVLREFIDLIVILAALFVNIIIGFLQEYKADRTLWNLKKLVRSKAKVLREGLKHEIYTEKIVPGDVMFLEAGDKVPADARIVQERNLQVQEAVLTGESVPSDKNDQILKKETPLADRENMVFTGSTVVKGKAMLIVTATGVDTELGKITESLHEISEEETPLQKRFFKLSRTLGITLTIICILIFILGLIVGRDWTEMLLTSIALAVAAVPEGLPAAVSIILALGVQEIYKRKGLVRKLVSIETLGSATVICSDKTGTLTEGVMSISHIVVGHPSNLNRTITNSKHSINNIKKDGTKNTILALKIALLCNNATIENPHAELERWKMIGDSMEIALLLGGVQSGLDKEGLERETPRLDEIPFDEMNKFMATLHDNGDKNIIYIKGAPEILFNISKYLDVDGGKEDFTEEIQNSLKRELDEFARKGLRVLAVGYKEVEKNYSKFKDSKLKDITFVGFIALKDPLRKGIKETMDVCINAGIKPVIATGDHKLTAKIIAHELNLPADDKNIIEGKDLDKMSNFELDRKIENVEIFARVTPLHKLRIIDSFQRNGEVVAMTGDGVNDAPALKSADIGLALGSGTDVAKGVSDIILLDSNFKTIVSIIEQGRNIFEKIRKVTLYLLVDSFTEILLIGGALILGLPLPLLPVQILWINLVEDGLPSVALAFETKERDLMNDSPRKSNEHILNTEMKILIFIIGITTSIPILIFSWWLYKKNVDLNYVRTITFATLGFNSLIYIFSCRSLRHTIFHRNPFSNRFLNISLIIGIFLLIGAIYMPILQKALRTVPLTLFEWMIPISLAFFELILIEILKCMFIIRKKKVFKKL